MKDNNQEPLSTQEQIEKVARAICRAGICGPKSHLDEQEERNWRKFELEAKAAIQAMQPQEGWRDIECAEKEHGKRILGWHMQKHIFDGDFIYMAYQNGELWPYPNAFTTREDAEKVIKRPNGDLDGFVQAYRIKI